MKSRQLLHGVYASTMWNVALMMLLFSVCRLLFFLLNATLFPDTAAEQIWTLFVGGLRFDLSGLLWVNSIYISLIVLPLKCRYSAVYQRAMKIIFMVFNIAALAANLADTIYFKFTLRRTTATIFSEFAGESNAGGLLKNFVVDYWYMWLVWFAMIAVLVLLYRKASKPTLNGGLWGNLYFYGGSTLAMVVFLTLCVCGARSSFSTRARPLAINHAAQYTRHPIESAIVQNTPFCILRSVGKQALSKVHYFDSEAELEAAYNPIIAPHPRAAFRPMNVVVIIWESLSREHVGSLNRHLENGTYQGFTPFVDSLVEGGLTFTASYANGRRSIEALPAVLASLPSFGEPFALSPYAGNQVNSIASLLKSKGYTSSFFHGSTSTTMGFWPFAKMAGFDIFYGEKSYGNRADHDGTWGIWDEEFLQFMAKKLSEQPQPFCSAVFTISSHHPFRLPARYRNVFVDERDEPMLKCIRYTDHALQRFFATARRQPWYSNTLFVLTADHTNRHIFAESQNTAAQMSIPIVFYAPSLVELRGQLDRVVQQTDIMPTIMGLLSYDKPLLAFGTDALDTVATHVSMSYLNGVYYLYEDHWSLLFDGEKTAALYDLKSDPMMQTNVAEQHDKLCRRLERTAKGLIQQYNNRIIENRLIP
jgi:phosphoglycerol transferase MdoB-like AlkP superfamily enzyme